jgi:hypothetical protein
MKIPYSPHVGACFLAGLAGCRARTIASLFLLAAALIAPLSAQHVSAAVMKIPALRAVAQERPLGSDTVHVAPPSGEMEADRANILSALEAVPPGGTVQFAEGRYTSLATS